MACANDSPVIQIARNRGPTAAGAFLLGLLAVGTIQADETAGVVPLSDLADTPYCYVGQVEASNALGSGVLVGSDRTVATAAHVIHDDDTGTWHADGATWERKGTSDERVAKLWARGARYIATYADNVADYGVNSDATFAVDFAVLYSYQSVSPAPLAPLSVDPERAVTGSSRKSVLGFPSGLYDRRADYRRERLHETGPFTMRLYQELGDYYGRNSVSTGPGASGGGLFVEEAGQWRLAALLISGLEKSLGDPRNAMGVVLLSTAKQALIDEAIEESHTHDPPEILSSPEEVVADWNSPTEVTVTFESLHPVEVDWIYKKPNHYRSTDFDPAWVSTDTNSSTLTIPPQSLFLHGKVLQATVRTEWTSETTEAIPFSYRSETPLAITQAPQSLELQNNATAVFTVVAESFPDPPTYQWEIDREGNGTFERIWDSEWLVGAMTDQLTMRPDDGRYSGTPLRVRISNHQETVVSDPVTATWTDAGALSVEVITALPDRLEPGETAALELGLRGTGGLDHGTWGAKWSVQRQSGAEYTVFPYSFGPYQTADDSGNGRLKIWISNDGDSVNGDQLRFTAKGGGYADGVWVPFEQTLEFTILSSGDPPSIKDFSIASSADASTLSLDLVTGGPTEIEWQVSFDEGASWIPVSTDSVSGPGITRFPFDLGHYQQRGAWIRAKITDVDFTVRSEPLQLTGETTLSMEGIRRLTAPAADRGFVLTTSNDRFAYLSFSTIDIYEKGPASWQRTARIPVGEGEEVYRAHFLDPETLVATRPDYAGPSGEAAAGGLSVFTRQPDGSWPETAFLPATSSNSGGLFGNELAGSENWLAVCASPTSEGQQDSVHLFQRAGNSFTPVDTIPIDFLSGFPRVTGMDLEGNQLLLRFAGNEEARLYAGDPVTGHWDANPLPIPSVTAGTYLAQGYWWQLSPTSLDVWSPQGDFARVELDPAFVFHTYTFFPGPGSRAWASVYPRDSNELHVLVFEADFARGRIHCVAWKIPLGTSVSKNGIESDYFVLRGLHESTLQDKLSIIEIRDLLPTAPGPEELWWFETTSTLEAGQAVLTMHVRLPAGVDPKDRLEVSQNLDTWGPFAGSATAATLVEADADGDGLTALWELRLPALIEGRPAYYRLANE